MPHLFATIITTRSGIINSLKGSNKANTQTKNDYWDYDKNSGSMPYGKFKEFINNLDEACSLTQGSIDLDQAVKTGNACIAGDQSGNCKPKSTETTEVKPAQEATPNNAKNKKSKNGPTSANNEKNNMVNPIMIERMNLNGIPFQ